MSEQHLWSATTLISNGVPKPALVGWAAKMTAEYALDNLDVLGPLAAKDRAGALKLLTGARFNRNERAATRGTDVHNALEQIALGAEPHIVGEAEPYVEQFRRFLAEHRPEYLAAEAPVYNPEHLYAGTLDGIVQFPHPIKGKLGPFVLDVKTTDKEPGSDPLKLGKGRPPYPEVALQLTAYRRAQFVGIEPAVKVEHRSDRFYSFDPDKTQTVPMMETHGGLCLVVSPFDYQLVPIRTDDLVWRAFLSVAESARWSLETSKQVIGKPVPPPTMEALAA